MRLADDRHQPARASQPKLACLRMLHQMPTERRLVGLSRFELLTPRLSSVCSNQLSYRPSYYSSPYSQKLSKNLLPILRNAVKAFRQIGPGSFKTR
jgi:hypothetical protein